ncbi:MAG TPA: DNA polymerase I, partial [Planctomycetaceae bacterium]|nr:DNA polymerase I [Planctomycetaceae bacterium]
RRVAKAVNFGVIYGQSAYGLSEAIGIGQDEAARFIDEYFARYAGVAQFLDALLEECRRSGYARTILGRRRPIRGIRAVRPQQRNMPERTAINTVIQGSAADLIKRAMIAVHRRIQQDALPGRMLLQIHDELVFEAPREALREFIRTIQEEMESAMRLNVPLKVDVKVGENWLDLKSASDAGIVIDTT